MKPETAAWAAQEIRDLDLLCRSQVHGYEGLHSSEMQRLKELEAFAKGVIAKEDPELTRALAENKKMKEVLGAIKNRMVLSLEHMGVLERMDVSAYNQADGHR